MSRWLANRWVATLAAGALFGLGLVISGMTDPRNVIGFLDVTGAWKPALIGVMGGAIAVHATLLWLIGRARRRGGVGGAALPLPLAGCATDPVAPRRALDARLLAGAAIFGVGWGVSGYCPGPAIVALGLGGPSAFGFLAAMIAGTLIADRVWPANR